MIDIREKRKLAILAALRENGQSAGSAEIANMLIGQGYEVSERTVRMDLLELDQSGLTRNLGRKGRRITEKGLGELESAHVMQRVGFLSAKIDQMTYWMTFDLATRTGSVVVNTSLVEPRQLASCVDKVCKVFEKGYAMGMLLGLLQPGESIGKLVVPEGKLGFCSVCSITLNGVLLKHGIPTRSRFGGLLELREGQPRRFVEIITYDGTTVDPLEVFIRSAMTNYVGAVESGNGRIGASFREFPAESRQLTIDLAQKLADIGLGGLMEVGMPGRDLLDIPVSEGRIGAIVIGGLNPVAILEELGMRVTSKALSGLLDFNRLFNFRELPEKLKNLI